MPFPISINVGDGSAAAVAVSSAAVVLVLVLRPIIKKAKEQDLRFFAGCALSGALALLLTGAICTFVDVPSHEEGDEQELSNPSDKRPANVPGVTGVDESRLSGLDQLSARDCQALKAKAATAVGRLEPRLKQALKLCKEIVVPTLSSPSRS